ncbi:MAG: hypothetical protein IJN92_01515 [Lachnospiraceae bacterium]|nr:hypothetical protein [Lachnospiraceae bacterium]
MKRTPKIISLFNMCFGILFCFLWIEMLFFNNSNNLFHPIKQICFALVWVCILAVSMLVMKLMANKFSDFFKAHFKGVLYGSMAILFLLQILFVYCTSTVIGWDCNNLITPALADEIGSYNTYFSQYPHNLFLLLIFKGLGNVFKWLGVANMWFAYSVFNTVMVDVAILFLVKTSALISSKKSAFITLFAAVLFLGFTPYLIVPYTDTLSMPFIIGGFYFFCHIFKNRERGERKLFPYICFPFCLLIGFFIKPTTVILLIAIGIIFLCYHFSDILEKGTARKSYLKLTGYFVGCGLFIFIGFKGFHSYVDTMDMFNLNRNLSVPMTHYLMMGTNILETETGYYYGGFNMDDIGITMSQTNPEDAKAANLTEYKRRMKEFGVLGYFDFLNKKARQVTSEGDFYWGDEGSFADWSQVGKNVITEFVYPNGTYYRIYTYMLQGIWILVFFGVAFSPFLQKREKENELYTIVRCGILGSLLFILIFEGRSRYLINYLPFYVLLFSWGLEQILSLIRKPFLNDKGQ